MPEDWHALPVEAALSRLGSGEHGLSIAEAAARLATSGPNELIQFAKTSRLKIFLSQFLDALVIILIIAAAISAVLGLLKVPPDPAELYDAILIAIIVVLNALFGYVQEYRAEKSLEALRSLAAPKAHVIRGGEPTTVPAREVVPGDVVILSTGDKVPADLRLIETASLRVNEASLTGESMPVSKGTAPLPGNTFLADRRNTAYMGTLVDAGRGRGVVVATAMSTELGKIAGMVQQEEKTETPLQRQLARLGKQLGLMILGISAVVFVIGYIEDPNKIEELFLTAVSLAVAAIPEGLPAVVTISLALGVQRMVRQNALVRKLSAVEALGAATVICSDKTGTLTKGEMNVRAVFAGGQEYEVEGEGFDPRGEILRGGAPVSLTAHPDLAMALRCGMLCNDATVRRKDSGSAVEGDATEIALIVAGMRAGLTKESLETETPRVAEIAFSSERKKMSTIHAGSGGGRTAFVKGAPERILAGCTRILLAGEPRPLDDYTRNQILFRNQEMATRALRVLGLAYGELAPDIEVKEENVETDLVFLGLAGMMDAPRRDAIAAVKRAKRAGIRIVMITGDHKLTAMAVAREMGILEKGDLALTGEDLDTLPPAKLQEEVERVRVYARVSPEHKMKIVDAWRARGHIVAMTGDGVNDAPALKRSDLGVAMGITGTDVAKESADIVLTDDNFASIIAAVEEGRGIYENIRKFVAYLLSANAGEVLIMFLATIILTNPEYLPFFEPVQLLWINLVTDGLPALALGVDPYPKDVMERPPRDPKENVLSRDVLFFIVIIAGILTVGTLGVFFLELVEHPGDIVRARGVAFTTIVFFELFLVFSIRSPRETLWKVGFLTNKKLIVAVVISAALQVAAIQIPFLEPVFDTRGGLDPLDWLQTIVVGLTAFLFVEVSKVVRRFVQERTRRA